MQETITTNNMFQQSEKKLIKYLYLKLIPYEKITKEDEIKNKMLITNSVKILKYLLDDKITLLDFYLLISNQNDEGRKQYLIPLRKKMNKMIETNSIQPFDKFEIDRLLNWFLDDYYGSINPNGFYERCIFTRFAFEEEYMDIVKKEMNKDTNVFISKDIIKEAMKQEL